MKKLLITFYLTFLSINLNSQNLNSDSKFPIFKEYNENEFSFSNFDDWYFEKVTDSLFGYKIEKEDIDQLGFKHIKIQQLYNNIEIENAVYILHTKNNYIRTLNGYLYSENPIQNTQKINSAELINIISNYENGILNYNSSNKTKSRKKDQTFNKKYITNFEKKIVLCYEVEIESIESLIHEKIFINIESGKIEKKTNLNHFLTTKTEVETVYSGKKTITTEYTEDIYKLLDNSRGKGIETLSLNNQTNLFSTQQIIDSNNTWNKFKNSIDRSALDVHFGATATYDYFYNIHKRNSIDDNGYKLTNLVHYGQNFVNAYWDGSKMIFGDGNEDIGPLVSLDIIGHEISHGLTSNTAKLILENESGALNESFSDIFGVLIDFYTRPDKANWTVAEEVSPLIRSLENPAINNDPSTYFGKNWKPLGGADFGGIHSNNGVQNHWFYLLANGGKGINDNNDTFDLQGIGIEKAGQIVYRNLVYYLTPQSTFNDARLGSIKASEDLFGNCSKEVESVTNAWYAVGIGNKYESKINADYEVSYTSGCDSLTVIFYNKSQNANEYLWDFGDKTYSNEFQPKHTYNREGKYTVKLNVSGSDLCGSKDSIINYDLINIYKNKNIQNENEVITCSIPFEYKPNIKFDTLSNLNWYDLDKKLIQKGLKYQFKNEKDTIIYFEGNHYNLGIKNSNLNTAFYNFNVRHQVFDVYKPLIIESVEVNALNAGERIIELRNEKGIVQQTKKIYIPAGVSNIKLNLKVDPGKDYQLGVGGNIIGLSRSNVGVKYPYEIKNLISIKRSNAQSAGYDFYYFFYDWDVKPVDSTTNLHKTKLIIDRRKFDTVLIHQVENLIEAKIDTQKHEINWFDCEQKKIILNENDSIYKPLKQGSFALVINEKNCNLGDTTPCLNFLFTNLNLKNKTFEKIEINPNPSNDILYLKFDLKQLNELICEITTFDGKKIMNYKIETESIDISSLTPGLYILNFRDKEGRMIDSKKITKL